AYAVSEIDAIAQDLPLENSSDWEEGRATRGAALALKSRLLLYAASPLYTGGTSDAQKWTDAAMAAKAVMDLGLYALYPDYGDLFLSEGSTSETIFARYYNL